MFSQSLPTVDIVIPVKNEARYLGQCLEALQNQTYTKKLVKVYLVDNGSTDNSSEIAARFPVEVIACPQGTVAAVRNQGICQGCGELVGFLDAHAIPERGWILGMVEAFLRDPLLGGCQGAFDFRYDDPRIQELDRRYIEAQGHSLNDDGMLRNKGSAYPWIMSGNCMYRREALEAVNSFREDVTRCEDVDLAWRVLFEGYELGCVPEARAVHYDGNDWAGFRRKYFNYGRGAAQLAQRYQLRPSEKKLHTSQTPSLQWLYQAGFWWESLRAGAWFHRTAESPYPLVSERLRPVFEWQPGQTLSISRQVVFWRKHPTATVLATVPPKHQFELEGASNALWQHLTRQGTREALLSKLRKQYPAEAGQIESQMDACLQQLIDEGVVIASA